jgi:kynureninase
MQGKSALAGVRAAIHPLLRFRDEFPILGRSTYLISNSLGAMPRRAEENLRLYAQTWAEKGVTAWDGWLKMTEEHGDRVAELLGAAPGTVMMHPNVSAAQAVAASALDFTGKRNKVILSALEFPTVVYHWKAWEKFGARVVVVPTEDGITVPTERLVAAIDDETLIVPFSHVVFRSGFMQDARAIVEAAHRKGALAMADVYQSIGAAPLDVEGWGADFAVGGSVKWLCGGAGAGFLYVRPGLREKLTPALTGWFGHKAPFDFDVENLDRAPAQSPWRFAMGTPDVPALHAARPGLDIILEAGVEHIRDRSVRLTSRLIEKAQERGFAVNTPLDPALRGGHVTIDLPDAARVAEELIRRKFIVDFRPSGPTQKGGIRVSPHFYNTEDEVDAVVAEMAGIA